MRAKGIPGKLPGVRYEDVRINTLRVIRLRQMKYSSISQRGIGVVDSEEHKATKSGNCVELKS